MSDFDRELPETAAFVDVKLLNGGSMTAHYHKLHAGEPAVEFRMYNWAFYIYHPGQQRHIIWDLGLSSVRRWEYGVGMRTVYSPIAAHPGPGRLSARSRRGPFRGSPVPGAQRVNLRSNSTS